MAQGIYVWLCWQELYYLVLAAFGNAGALGHVTFLLSVMAIAASDRLMPHAGPQNLGGH